MSRCDLERGNLWRFVEEYLKRIIVVRQSNSSFVIIARNTILSRNLFINQAASLRTKFYILKNSKIFKMKL